MSDYTINGRKFKDNGRSDFGTSDDAEAVKYLNSLGPVKAFHHDPEAWGPDSNIVIEFESGKMVALDACSCCDGIGTTVLVDETADDAEQLIEGSRSGIGEAP